MENVMENRIVKLIYPRKSSDIAMVDISISKVPFSKTHMTIYDTVTSFEHEIFLKSGIKTVTTSTGYITNRILLRDVINLHNNTGIKNTSQIKSMVQQIKSGSDILSPTGLPNIKLVKTNTDDWVLFDGHHSMLAYMLAERKYLDEIPHLIVEDEKNVFVSNKEICVFFGEHQTRLKGGNWREYVINWQAQKKKDQLQKRIQNNMGELLDSLIG